MKLSFKHLTAACAALLLGSATLNAQTGTMGTSSAGAPATDQQSPDRTPTTPTSPATSGSATTATPDNNVPGSAATDTSTNAAPSTSAATSTNTSTTTTSTQASKRSTMAPRTIYLGTGYKGTPASLTIKHGYKVYDENGKLVGHLTDLSGSTIKSLPASGDFEIKTRAGKLIGSTQSGDGVDSSRAVQLTR